MHKDDAIRLFVPTLDGGGSERICLELCNRFVDRTLTVELLLVNASGVYLQQLDSRVNCKDFRAKRARGAFVAVSRHIRSSPEIPVLVFGFHLCVLLIMARFLGWHSSRVIYREGSSPVSHVKPWMQWVYRFFIARADAVIAQNHTVRKELESLGVPHQIIRVIPNPCPRPSAMPVRPPPQEGRSLLLLGVGRLEPEKGFDRLLRAFSKLSNVYRAARLVILGEGRERSRLERLIESLGMNEQVTMPGFVKNLNTWLDRASLFVLSSHFEGQPNVLMEAILRECPVLCVEGKGGGRELMVACGLEDCVVADAEFEHSFVERVGQVLCKSDFYWRQARELLIRLADPDSVVTDYLDTCGVKPLG